MTGLTITPRQARAADACRDGYRAGLSAHMHVTGERPGLDTPISITTILDRMGVDDALWCLGAVRADRVLRMWAADCAERVVHLTGPDPRCVTAIRVARLHARGLASAREMDVAEAAAMAAARDAARAAGDVAEAAAMAAAMAAARAAAGAAAWDAARDAAAAAWDAAGAAAWAAAWDAARAAARAAAWDAARADEREWQRVRLRAYLTGEAR